MFSLHPHDMHLRCPALAIAAPQRSRRARRPPRPDTRRNRVCRRQEAELKKTVRDGDPKKTDQQEHARSDRLKEDKFKPAPTVVNAVTNAWAVRWLLKGPLTGRKVLDVGTGYGYLLAELEQRFDMTATGVELSSQEAKFGKEVLGVDLINCPLSDSGLQPSSFDVVTCFEVIEHVARPRDFIDELLRYLKPDGVMIVMTDNFGSDAVETLGSSFPKWIPHSHISHFDATTVCAMMQEKGLKIGGRLSFTPWETAARALLVKLSGGSRNADTFDLEKVLRTEMGGDYRLFPLRRWLNTTWARLTCRDDLQGSLMYVAANPVR